MSDVNANIKVSIDSSQALSELKSLQRQISLFHNNIAKSSAQAALAQQTLQTDLLNAVNATGRFSAEMRTVKTSTESFTNSLEKNKFSIRQYFRYAAGSTKTFGKIFRSEFDTISQVAEDRVKRMQTQYIEMGRNAKGAMQAMAITPKQLDLNDFATKTQIAAQKQQLFNQLLKQGSTNLLNFGKNTQWAGRQLMVGFTLPLATLGTVASKSFMDMEAAALKFRKVYGDLMTPASETQYALDNIKALADQYTKYGIAASSTVALAADAAAAGFKGVDLQAQTTQATRLAVLGQIDQQKALETTISLQNAFRISSTELADAINFLNSVENQTVLSLDDVTTAIPIASPIVKSLGGDVKDLAFFMTAMKEGGINASEGANALKSGLASIINPSKKASDILKTVGINIRGIVEENKGDLKSTVIGVADALNTLDPLNRARAIEQLFGKFQFSRISTLFANITKDGTQASRVLDLAQMSMSDLAATADKELGMTADSAMNKFKKAVEDLKVALVPVGEAFLQAVTPVLEFLNNILSGFKDMSEGSKKAITLLITIVGGLGPVLLMTFGLLANGLANILKLFGMLRGGYLKLTGQTNVLGEQTQYLTSEQIEAAAVASSLEQSHARLTQRFTVEAIAVNQLRDAYIQATSAAMKFSINNPGLMANPKKYAKGISIVPGSGNKDSVPAMLMPGEAVIPTDKVKKYGPLIQGMIAGNIPGFADGKFPSMQGGIQRMLAPYTMFAPGNNAGGFGMSPDFLDQIGFIESLRNTAIAAGSVEGDLKLTQSTINDMANEVMPYATSITEKLRETSQNMTAAGKPAKHISEIFAEAELEIKKILASMKAQGGRIASTAEGLRKFAYPTESDIMSGGYARVPGVTVDPATGAVVKSTIYSNKGGKSGSFDRRLKSVTRTQPIQASGVMTKAHIVPENLGIIAGNATLQGAALKLPMEKQMAARAEIERKGAIVAGRKYASAYADGLEAGGLEDIYVESRKRNSPHPLAAQDGADDARAYQKAKSNKLLTYGTTGPVSAIDKSIRRNREKTLRDLSSGMSVSSGILGGYGLGGSAGGQQQAAVKQSTKNLNKMNNALMSGTFALTSLAGMGSMTGGKLGDVSQQIMKYSGSLFALMTVTQLLTQASTMELIAKRRAIASEAINSAVGAGGVASRSGLLGSLAKVGIGLTRFIGPIGLATAGLFATYKIIQMSNAARERERQAIEGLGNVAVLTKEKLKTLGDFFGIVPLKLPFERKGPAVAAAPDQRSQIQQLRENSDFAKEFKNDINALKKANASSAGMVLKSLAVQLRGRGFQEAQIETIIKALQEEAQQTKLDLDFKNISVVNDSEIKQQAAVIGQKFAQGFKNSYTKYINTATGSGRGAAITVSSIADWTPEAKAKMDAAGKAFFGLFQGMLGQFEQGIISSSEFNQQFKILNGQINAMPENAKLKMMSSLFAQMGPDAQKAVEGIKNVNTQMRILLAMQIVDLGPLANGQENPILKALKSLDSKTVLRGEKQLSEIINGYFKGIDGAIKEGTKTLEESGKSLGEEGTKNALQQLIERTKEIEKQTAAYKKLRTAGVDAAIAEEMAGNVDLVKILDATKYLGKNWNTAVTAIKEYGKKQKELEKTVSVGGGAGEYQQYLFKRAEAFISLQEQLIDMQYKTQLKGIETQTQVLNTQLDDIKLKEDQINEKFDKQIGALNTIKTLNENIANQEKQRLTIADALSRGDISAAAVAIQEARAQQASASMEAAQQGLATGKDTAIAALGAKEIQKQIDALNKQRQVIEDTIQKQKESITYFGMTADQIRDAAKALDLANEAGININNPTFLNNILKAATGDSSALKSVMIDLQTEARNLFAELQNLRSVFLNTGGGMGGVGVGPSSGPTVQQQIKSLTKLQKNATPGSAASWRIGEQLSMLEYNQLQTKAFGGIVGGSGMTDKIPTLLTPGEFIVNKNATKKFGPLLNSINESKYPSSLLTGSSPTVLGVNSNSVNNNSSSVYNYSLNIDASGGSANPNDIARIVIGQIKNMDAQRIRGNRY
jgi:TP901 family phage tail tape measure protein